MLAFGEERATFREVIATLTSQSERDKARIIALESALRSLLEDLERNGATPRSGEGLIGRVLIDFQKELSARLREKYKVLLSAPSDSPSPEELK